MKKILEDDSKSSLTRKRDKSLKEPVELGLEPVEEETEKQSVEKEKKQRKPYNITEKKLKTMERLQKLKKIRDDERREIKELREYKQMVESKLPTLVKTQLKDPERNLKGKEDEEIIKVLKKPKKVIYISDTDTDTDVEEKKPTNKPVVDKKHFTSQKNKKSVKVHHQQVEPLAEPIIDYNKFFC